MGKKKLAVMDDSIEEATKETKGSKVSKAKTEEAVIAKQDREGVIPNASEESVDAPVVAESANEEAVSETDSSAAPLNDKKEEVADEKKIKKTKASKATQKKGKAKYRSVKYKEAAQKSEKSKKYPLAEAIDLAKQTSYSKFDGSLEMHLSTNAKNIRGLISLPFASGKKLKILAFGPPSLKASDGQGKELEELGAEIGDDEKLNEIIRGVTGFDVIVTTAEWMPKLARAAKVLGPRGLMPSPKNGTITSDLKKAVTEIQSGKVEYKTQKDSQVIHLTLGKVSQPTDEVVQNTKILFNAIGKTRIKKAVISPSMGIGVKVELSSI